MTEPTPTPSKESLSSLQERLNDTILSIQSIKGKEYAGVVASLISPPHKCIPTRTTML